MAEVSPRDLPFYSTALPADELAERLLSMTVDGELTARGARHAIFNTDKLSPGEREGLRERMKAAAGNNRLTNTLVDIAMDPWVWALFITSPLGGASLGAGWNRVAKSVSPYFRQHAGLLGAVGLLSSGQYLKGTRVRSAVARVEEAMRLRLEAPHAIAFDEAVERTAKGMGLNEERLLLWRKYRKGTPEGDAAYRASVLLAMEGEGFGRNVAFLRPGYVTSEMAKRAAKKGKTVSEGFFTKAIGKKGVRPAVVNQRALDRALDDIPGGRELLAHGRQAMNRELLELVPDGASWLKLLRGVMDSRISGVSAKGARAGYARFARSVVEGFEKAKDKTKFLNELDGTMRKVVANNYENYMPRNIVEKWQAGAQVDPDMLGFQGLWPSGVRGTRSARARVRAAPNLHPDDWAWIEREVGLTKEGAKYKRASEALARESGPQSFQRLDFQGQVNRYMQEVRRSHALFVQDVGPELRAVDRAGARPATAKTYRGGGSLADSIEDIESAGKAPPGGFSVADVLAGEMELVSDPRARAVLGRVVIPHLAGRVATRDAIGEWMNAKGRELAGAFVSTAAGRAIERSGDWGRRTMEQWRRFSEYKDVGGRGFSRGGAKLLYASHLGLNVLSALINATQPFLHAGSWVGYKNVLRGYAAAFGELGSYLGARARQGFKPISSAERDGLIRKHFKHWEVTGISGSTMENLENMTVTGELARRSVKSTRERLLFEYPMKLFEKAEWLNRSVVAHAVERRMIDEGADLALLKATQRGVVEETQFGGHWMNTMVASVPGGEHVVPRSSFLQNPLIRQFLTFQVRALTAATHTASRLAGGEGMLSASGLAQFLRTTVRALGASAIGVYAVRDLLDADLSRAGYGAAVTDLVPGLRGGRFDPRDDTLPAPPVVRLINEMRLGFSDEESSVWQKLWPRVAPGGLVLSRLVAAGPHVPVLSSVLPVGQRVGWSRAQRDEEGRLVVPVYDERESLIGWQPAWPIVAGGLGLSVEEPDAQRKVEARLLSAREEVLWYRRNAALALVNGQSHEHERLAAQFQKRFGIPLTISKDYLDRTIQNVETPRTERIFQGLPRDVKPLYRGESREQMQQAAGPEPQPTLPGAVEKDRAFGGFDSFRAVGAYRR